MSPSQETLLFFFGIADFVIAFFAWVAAVVAGVALSFSIAVKPSFKAFLVSITVMLVGMAVGIGFFSAGIGLLWALAGMR